MAAIVEILNTDVDSEMNVQINPSLETDEDELEALIFGLCPGFLDIVTFESESEDEMLFTVGDFLIPGITTPHSRGQSLHPRPAFSRKPSQRWLLPF